MMLITRQPGINRNALFSIDFIKDRPRQCPLCNWRLSDRKRSMAYTDINNEDRLVQVTFGLA